MCCAGIHADPQPSESCPPWSCLHSLHTRWVLRYFMAVILQTQRTLLLSGLSCHYKWRIWQEEEGKAFVASLWLGKQSWGFFGGRVERRELNFISLGICHWKIVIMYLDAWCEGHWVSGKDSFVLHLQKTMSFITQGLAPRDGSRHCSTMCHPPCVLAVLCWCMEAFQYLLREL